ncbi:tryptophan synthase subunit alpha [Flavihumibacter petaseus]|uniref:Tryptophan synthase alpha chain n=1 Tax=Flavihumibacter petaseus NBRC 106054 TaxID=1220578 RepID=A0A0E9N0G4_9BACT|nr:tryptophan synthase subunit alpha [Flavihumibacter petaseus]GAO43482.1 tryptophan synthase alpha chain [Flavihumibacter petaseus NBRC 106054]
MSKIKSVFVPGKAGGILNVYITAGYPQLNSLAEILPALQDGGADLVEIGIPYSDPLADGPVIQHSSTVALANGMTLQLLLEQLSALKDRLTVPVILMGYMNSVMQYGFEKFCADAAAAGVSGLILPDLPEFEFRKEYGAVINRNGLDFIFLVTPETAEERVRRLDELSNGFLYAVSSSSTTGSDKDMSAVIDYLQRLKKMKLKNPVLVGFGIRDRQSFAAATAIADGAIIGSAFIQSLENSSDPAADTTRFLQSIRS